MEKYTAEQIKILIDEFGFYYDNFTKEVGCEGKLLPLILWSNKVAENNDLYERYPLESSPLDSFANIKLEYFYSKKTSKRFNWVFLLNRENDNLHQKVTLSFKINSNVIEAPSEEFEENSTIFLMMFNPEVVKIITMGEPLEFSLKFGSTNCRINGWLTLENFGYRSFHKLLCILQQREDLIKVAAKAPSLSNQKSQPPIPNNIDSPKKSTNSIIVKNNEADWWYNMPAKDALIIVFMLAVLVFFIWLGYFR